MKVGIIGAGVMGEGIAHRVLRSGLSAVLIDSNPCQLSRFSEAFDSRASVWGRLKGEHSVGVDGIADRINLSTSLGDVRECKFIIETISERMEDKLRLYLALGSLTPELVPVASNTSVIPIENLARAGGLSGRAIGIHFMNPADIISSVEVVFPAESTVSTISVTREFLKLVGLSYVEARDGAGFISNRVLMPMINEAVHLLDESLNTPAAIDAVFRNSMGHRMGPLETADLIGLDTIDYSLKNLMELTGRAVFEPALGLRNRVQSGKLGVKSGEGFYFY